MFYVSFSNVSHAHKAHKSAPISISPSKERIAMSEGAHTKWLCISRARDDLVENYYYIVNGYILSNWMKDDCALLSIFPLSPPPSLGLELCVCVREQRARLPISNNTEHISMEKWKTIASINGWCSNFDVCAFFLFIFIYYFILFHHAENVWDHDSSWADMRWCLSMAQTHWKTSSNEIPLVGFFLGTNRLNCHKLH